MTRIARRVMRFTKKGSSRCALICLIIAGFFFGANALESTRVKCRKIEFLAFKIEFFAFKIEFFAFQIEFLAFRIKFIHLRVEFLRFGLSLGLKCALFY